MDKLPPELQLINRRLADAEFDLTSILEVMRERIHPKGPKPAAQVRKPTDQHQSTVTALVSGLGPMPTCCFCQQQHLSSTYTVVVDIEARKEILKKFGHCFCCLKKGHLS